jgi:hypothetical protein
MTIIIMLLLPLISFAEMQGSPTAFPVFLREGFSTILEFEEPPSRVVLGDGQSFQVERLDRSVVIKTLEPYAVSNMFVYFKTKSPRLFVLNASEEAEPTYYKKFETIKPPLPKSKPKTQLKRGAYLKSATFNKKKDHLVLEIAISADHTSKIIPEWSKVRLAFKDLKIEPKSLWSERKEVQKDSSTKARLAFLRPNIPKDLSGASLIIPIRGQTKPFIVNLAKGAN